MNERIIFLGTPSISAYVLQGLINSNFNIVATITKPDKIRGRNNKIEESDVASLSKKYNIKVFKPFKIKEIYEDIKSLNPDLLLTFAYGQLIPDSVLELSKYKPLNLHGSLLPKYRGAAPIQYALKNGDKQTGISLMEMIHEMDAGNVYAKEIVDIEEDDNYTSLCDKLKVAALKLATLNLPLYFNNKLIGVKQDENLVSFSPSIKKEEEHLDLNLNCIDFINQVRSLSFTPGGYLLNNDEIIKIYKVKYYSNSISGSIGEIVKANKKEIILQLKDGQVNIELIQRPGKKMMNSVDFNNGYKNFEKTILN